ncbi:acyltransferase [Vibrio sp. SCSIO 43136]|uniref:acyltransferase n=1 Tax=Vibrio sp. SCSIO 43136 TaxID=2819101 RepID=UPI002074D4DD|nr:acyltransferase [Vibrio sp. SCSIO 43136]USD67434.1 N-acetyltransferase [Vibrio sp. SCSIO 43136]
MTIVKIRKAHIVDVKFGANVTLIDPVNLYGCHLEDDVFVGPFVEIQKNTTIGAGTKVQSHSFICEFVTIGHECFIGHGVMFANDLFQSGKPDPNPDNWGRIKIGNHVSIGSNATILPVSICDGAVIGAGSVVTKDITEKGVYVGNPAKKIRSLD